MFLSFRSSLSSQSWNPEEWLSANALYTPPRRNSLHFFLLNILPKVDLFHAFSFAAMSLNAQGRRFTIIHSFYSNSTKPVLVVHVASKRNGLFPILPPAPTTMGSDHYGNAANV